MVGWCSMGTFNDPCLRLKDAEGSQKMGPAFAGNGASCKPWRDHTIFVATGSFLGIPRKNEKYTVDVFSCEKNDSYFRHKFRVSNFSCYLRVARIALWQNTSETGARFLGVSENAEESPGKFWPLQNGENMMRIHDPSSGWWFGTCFLLSHILGMIIPTDYYFSEG